VSPKKSRLIGAEKKSIGKTGFRGRFLGTQNRCGARVCATLPGKPGRSESFSGTLKFPYIDKGIQDRRFAGFSFLPRVAIQTGLPAVA
jgi:hypothetical protein